MPSKLRDGSPSRVHNSILGYVGIMGNKRETTIVYWGYTGIMENEMGTALVDWGYAGMMEKTMGTTVVYWGYVGIMEQIELQCTFHFYSKPYRQCVCVCVYIYIHTT